jgi:hypothetical protein
MFTASLEITFAIGTIGVGVRDGVAVAVGGGSVGVAVGGIGVSVGVADGSVVGVALT